MVKDKEFKPKYVDIPQVSDIVEIRENQETKKVIRYLWKFTTWTPPYASYWDYYYTGTVMKFYTEDWWI